MANSPISILPLMKTRFDERGPIIMGELMAEFGFSPVQAAGIVGNIGHESSGFVDLENGWCKWAGPRRRSFLAWCEKMRLDWRSDEGSMGYLVHELKNEYAAAVAALLKTNTVRDAVRAFERNFERAGEPCYGNREKWGARALRAYMAAQQGGVASGPAA